VSATAMVLYIVAIRIIEFQTTKRVKRKDEIRMLHKKCWAAKDVYCMLSPFHAFIEPLPAA
jgi:hypothetical protein